MLINPISSLPKKKKEIKAFFSKSIDKLRQNLFEGFDANFKKLFIVEPTGPFATNSMSPFSE
jgi:hypothetical protein